MIDVDVYLRSFPTFKPRHTVFAYAIKHNPTVQRFIIVQQDHIPGVHFDVFHLCRGHVVQDFQLFNREGFVVAKIHVTFIDLTRAVLKSFGTVTVQMAKKMK